MKAITIGVVVLESTLLSTAIGISDIMNIYNQFCKSEDQVRFQVNFLSVDGQFASIVLPTRTLSKLPIYDVIIIPPLLVGADFDFNIPQLNRWLIDQYHGGAMITSACIGSFFLANTGLLDTQTATTHWQYEERFKSLFPSVILKSEKILVDEGRIVTAGGVSAYVDLVLMIIERFHTKANARHCANLLLVDSGRDSQQCYKELPQTVMIEDIEIKKLLSWMQKNLHRPLSTGLLAQRLKLHERTFLRRFKNSVHITPNQYLQELRVDAAKSLLVNTHKSFDEITSEVGFENESSFRRLFKSETHLNPGEYRKKFQYSVRQ